MRIQKTEGVSFQPIVATITLFIFFQGGSADRLIFPNPSQKSNTNVNDSVQDTTPMPVGSWESVPEAAPYPLFAVDFATQDNGWAVGMGGEILKWDGKAWSIFPSPVQGKGSLLAVKQLTPTDGWIVGSSGTILHWDGSDWKIEPSPTDYDLYAITFLTPKLGWAVGGQVTEVKPGILNFDGVILKWDGARWTKVASPAQYMLRSITMLNEQNGWAVGQGNTILHWDGQSWKDEGISKPKDNFSLDFRSIAMNGTEEGWIVGRTLTVPPDEPLQIGGIILHWDGEKWSEFQRTELPLHSLSSVGQDFGWAVGGNYNSTQGGAILLKWNGKTWSEVPSPTKLPLEFVSATNPLEGWLLAGGETTAFTGNENAIFRYVIKPTMTPAPTTPALITPPATEMPASTVITPTSAPTLIPNQTSTSSSGFTTRFLMGVLLLLLAVGTFFFLSRQRKA